MINPFYKLWKLPAVAVMLTVITACQSHGGYYGVRASGTGEPAALHSNYFLQAMIDVQDALNRSPASFSGLPIDAKLESELRYLAGSTDNQSGLISSWKLIDRYVIDDGPYLFVVADEDQGRLDFESVMSKAHLSVYVEPRQQGFNLQRSFTIVGVSAEPLLQASLIK